MMHSSAGNVRQAHTKQEIGLRPIKKNFGTLHNQQECSDIGSLRHGLPFISMTTDYYNFHLWEGKKLGGTVRIPGSVKIKGIFSKAATQVTQISQKKIPGGTKFRERSGDMAKQILWIRARASDFRSGGR